MKALHTTLSTMSLNRFIKILNQIADVAVILLLLSFVLAFTVSFRFLGIVLLCWGTVFADWYVFVRKFRCPHCIGQLVDMHFPPSVPTPDFCPFCDERIDADKIYPQKDI